MNIFQKLFSTSSLEESSSEVKNPQKEVDFSHFERVTEFLYEKSGITDLDKRTLSLSTLKHFAESRAIYSTEEFLERMQRDAVLYQDVLNIVTVNETFFFREKKELEWLVSFIKNSKGKCSILSLPCSTGEEVYSILMLLDEAEVDLERVSIQGYDLNSLALESAKKGIYNEHSLHRLGAHYKEKYFVRYDAEHLQIVSKYRDRVKFSQKNIFEIREKNVYDIVISRNMFIYFDAQKREEATEIIVNLLRDGGYYIKGHADGVVTHPFLKSEAYGIYAIDKSTHLTSLRSEESLFSL